ncbi:zinc metallopeptidase [Tenacibaculum sp. AHE15PA]|uniref:zinc metallopeptidase n=1 Tax=unclassified Tenacibaculum TaxID=2635139 RepID=UPI001C4E6171|nr:MULTISPECIES: zinc metallopeptidase [unclassified Tenacibaculum]QXP72821.1 zinc metallopeptidase [Tenacibaculum sp. AHE14PA]QXP76735.1 zinc metallopeptidase [Tenacibaculum sp. AHE15PA]
MIGFYILIGIISLFSWIVSNTLKRKFKKYSQVHLRNGMSGAEIAQKMLDDHGINDVKVISTPGMLTDHYNPQNKTVNLSEGVYNQRNASAAAVAAHEVGHAVQHAKAYQWLTMRSKLVPIVSISSRFSQWMIIGGLILGAGAGQPGIGQMVAIGGLIFMAMGTLFSFITLPVEYDASNRALAWLENKHIVTHEELAGSKDALKWAARTYLVAALGSLAMLLYWALRILGSRD